MPLFRFPPPTPPWKRQKPTEMSPQSNNEKSSPSSLTQPPESEDTTNTTPPTSKPKPKPKRNSHVFPRTAASSAFYSNSPHPFAYAPTDILFFDPSQDRDRRSGSSSQYLQPEPHRQGQRQRRRDGRFFRSRSRDRRGRSRSEGREEDEQEREDQNDADGRSQMEAETGRRQLRPGRTHRRSRRVSRRRETGSSGEDEDDDEVEDDYAMNAAMCSNRSTSRYELEEGGDGENYFPFVMRRESVSREDVRARREMRWELERSNRSTLSSLATTSASFTTRLDNTFYTLLETASNLRTAVASLEHLTSLTSTLNTEFSSDTSRLEAEHKAHVANFDNFEPQMRKLEGLEERMQKARERAEALDERLHGVRKRVEAWDRREDEWQERVSRRLRIMWAVMGALAVVVAAWKFVQLVRPGDSGTVVGGLVDAEVNAFGNDSTLSNGYVEVLDGLQEEVKTTFGLVDDKESCHDDKPPAASTSTSTRDEQEQDERDPLRFLDEL